MADLENTRLISLTQNKFAIIDAEDFERVSQMKWYFHKKRNEKTGYAMHSKILPNGKKIIIKMHRFILNAPDYINVDHKNHNGLDNKKINLRLATQLQNVWNMSKRSNTTSLYKGVYWNKQKNRWFSRIRRNGKYCWLGMYKTQEEAAMAYNEAAQKAFGEFACINIL